MNDRSEVVLPLLHALVQRGKAYVNVRVPAHELDVLRVIHGSARVLVQGPADDEVSLDPSADAEVIRLRRKYGAIGAPDYVALAFPTGARDLERFGFDTGRSAGAGAPEVLVKDHKKLRKEAAAKEAAAKAGKAK